MNREAIIAITIDMQMDPLYMMLGIEQAEQWANGAWTKEVH